MFYPETASGKKLWRKEAGIYTAGILYYISRISVCGPECHDAGI